MAVLEWPYGRPLVAPRRRWDRPAVVAGLVAGVLSLAWALWLARDGGDLAAQYAWTAFVRNHPGSAYNLSWYGGIHPASYSVISPYLMALIGVRTTGVLVCTGCATLGGLLLGRSGIRHPTLPALWLAVALWCNILAGRVTYMLGMVFALAAAILTMTGNTKRRQVVAALLAVVASLCSPVAGLFIEVLAAALFLIGRRRRAYMIALGPPLVVGATSLLFPFSGLQPFPWYSAVPVIGAAMAAALLTPRSWRTVRAGSWVYAVGVALCWVIPTPIGSNVERLALLSSAAIVICAALARDHGGFRTVFTYLTATGFAIWTVVQPIVDYVHTAAPVPTASAADAAPLITELRQLGAERGRVEVVPLRTHWEAAGVAPYVYLARGWNRQADVQRNPLFYDDTLTAASYRDWLLKWSVGYVVLPVAEPDSAGLAESRIITTGQDWLPQVWSDADWRVYRVNGADPLASAPATVTYAGPAALTINVPRPGTALVRIAWSPWLAIDGVTDDETTPRACLTRSGAWTELVAPAAGTFTIEARYTLDRGTPCHRPSTAPH
jgi:hypothetical protein